jgi:hypothetical protein
MTHIRDSGDKAMSCLEPGRSVEEDLGDDVGATTVGDGDLGFGTCRRPKGLVIWFVCTL